MIQPLRRGRRVIALAVAGFVALASFSLSGIAQAADPLPPLADPTADGAFCEGVSRDNPFTDLGAESAATRDVILCLVGTQLTRGTTPSTFSPGAPVTRRQMAVFIKRLADLVNRLEERPLVDLPAYDQVPDYPDVLGEGGEFREAIGQLTQADIVEGFPDGTFRPGAFVSRRQMSAFVNRLQDHLTGARFTTANDYFDDDEGDPREPDLNGLASVGIFQGDRAGRVVPAGRLSRRQMANLLLRHAQVLLARGDIHGPGPGPGSPPTSTSTTSTTSTTTTQPPGPDNQAPTSLFAKMTTAGGAPNTFDAGDVVQIIFNESLAPIPPTARLRLFDTAPVASDADIINGVTGTFTLNVAPAEVAGSGLGLRPAGSVLTITLLQSPQPVSGLDPTLDVPATITSATGITDTSLNAWNVVASPDTQVER